MTEPLLRIEHLDTYYGESHIVQDVSLAVSPGESVALAPGGLHVMVMNLKALKPV